MQRADDIINDRMPDASTNWVHKAYIVVEIGKVGFSFRFLIFFHKTFNNNNNNNNKSRSLHFSSLLHEHDSFSLPLSSIFHFVDYCLDAIDPRTHVVAAERLQWERLALGDHIERERFAWQIDVRVAFELQQTERFAAFFHMILLLLFF